VNDPFDPDDDLGNKSAQGFDFWRDYYGEYICTRADISLQVYNQSDKVGITAYLLPSQGNVVPLVVGTSPIDYITNLPNVRYKTAGPIGSGRYRAYLRHKWTSVYNKAVGKRGEQWEGTSWGAATNASPGSRPAIFIWAGTQSGNPNTQGASMLAEYKLTVNYHVKFFARKLTPELDDPE